MVLTLVKQLEIAWTALSGSDDPDDEIRIAALDELIAVLFSEVWDGKKGVAFAETYFDIPDKEISHKLGISLSTSEATVSWHPESSLSWLVAIL